VDTIQRPHLHQRLCYYVSSFPLTLLSAPAGYGKTTLLSALPVLLPKYPLAWITLDTEDNDPIGFIGLLVASLQRLHPDCGRSIWPLISGGEVSKASMKHAVNILINDIAHYLPEPIILVLDDLHYVTEPVIHATLDYFLEKLPPNLHIVLSTRYDPPLRLARLAARRQLGELRRAELSFSTDEAQQLLNNVLKLSLSTAEVNALQARTEGWPGILCLLAGPLEHLGGPENRTQLMDAITNTDRQVLDFLAEEILLYLPEDVRLFLLQTSILVEMTPTACQAVTGRQDAVQILDGLYRHNLAIASIKTDAASEPVYRYHALFARLLNLRMESEFSKEEIADLHRKAALVQATPGRAISHYFSAGLWDQAAQLMVKSGMELLYRGMAETVWQWYGSMPAQIRSNYTHLSVLLARCEIHRGRYVVAGRLLEQARNDFLNEGDADGEGDALTSLITWSYHKNDRITAASYVARALQLPLRPMGQVAVRLAQAWLHMYEGNWETACTNIQEGLAIPGVTGDRRADIVGVTYTTAPMIVMPGCLQAAENYFGEVASLALPDTAWSLGAQELGTWPLLLRGKTEEALNRAEAAADLRQRLGGFPFVGNDLPLLLSVLYLAAGDLDKARQMTNKLVQHTEKDGLSSKGIDMLYLHAAGRALALLGQFDEAVIMQQRLAALDCSYLLTKYLACHLQGLIALLTGRQDDAVAILEEAAKLEIQLPVAHIGGSARLLQARLLMDQNNSENAFAVADPVISDWMIASTPGYVLLDGPVIKPVLRMLARRKRTGAGIMLHLFAKDLHGMDESDSIQASGPASAAPLSEPLTPREREVLKLLVAGRTNLQISAELFISKETVKSHVAHLMRKLDVNSRVQASIRARELGF
jgi:LuxR family maltose regulon positive regulatory protein